MEAVENPVVALVSDVVVKLIFAVPALRNKLDALLATPSEVHTRVQHMWVEVVANVPPEELQQLQLYLTQHTQPGQLVHVFEKAFTNIFADGNVDVNDSIHFLQLVHNIVHVFNTRASAPTRDVKVSVSSNCILFFLKFALKCILTLTLADEAEAGALRLVDQSFMLLQLTIAPVDIDVPRCHTCRCTIM